MPDQELPRSAKALVNKLDDRWTRWIVWGAGERTVRVKGLVNNRPGMVDAVVPVQSVSVRARHDHGQFLVAIWVSVDGGPWKFDIAFRRWHDLDWPQGLPVEMNASETTAYASAPDALSALRAISAQKAKAAESAKRRAATKAAKADAEQIESEAA